MAREIRTLDARPLGVFRVTHADRLGKEVVRFIVEVAEGPMAGEGDMRFEPARAVDSIFTLADSPPMEATTRRMELEERVRADAGW